MISKILVSAFVSGYLYIFVSGFGELKPNPTIFDHLFFWFAIVVVPYLMIEIVSRNNNKGEEEI